jgi:hypothetical protein
MPNRSSTLDQHQHYDDNLMLLDSLADTTSVDAQISAAILPSEISLADGLMGQYLLRW